MYVFGAFIFLLLLLCGVYKETGIWTTLTLFLVIFDAIVRK